MRTVEVVRERAGPRARGVESAALLAGPLGREVTIDEGLREITAGSYDGKSGREIFSEVMRCFLSPDTNWDTPYLGGETYRQLRERARSFLERVLADTSWRTLVAVAHGGINNALLSVVLDKNETAGLANVEQDFGCVNVIDHDGERFLVRMLNFTLYDPLKVGLRLPSVRILADLIGAQIGTSKDDRR